MKRLLSPLNCTPNSTGTQIQLQMDHTEPEPWRWHRVHMHLTWSYCSLFFYWRQHCRHNKDRQGSLINLESSVGLGGYQGGTSLLAIQLGWIPLPSNAVQLQRQGSFWAPLQIIQLCMSIRTGGSSITVYGTHIHLLSLLSQIFHLFRYILVY